MNKLKILILQEPEPMNGVTFWRMYGPMSLLEKMYGDQVEIIWNRGQILPVDIERAHVAIAWRPCNAAQLSVIQFVKSAGVKIVVDYDDDMINIPTGSAAYNTITPLKQNILAIIQMADMVWTSTDVLRKLYNHKNAHTVPNAVLAGNLPDAPNKINGTAIWRGDIHQVEDVYAAMDWYYKLVKKTSRFIWYGYRPTWAHPSNAEYRPWNSIRGYFNDLQSIRPNFIWKPMRENLPFNNGKSNIAKLEATLAGGVAITNFANRPTWENTLREIDTRPNIVSGLWEAARDEILANYNLETWTNTRYRLLMSLFD